MNPRTPVAPDVSRPSPRARAAFARQLAILKRYHEQHGDCLVPNSEPHQALAHWVSRLRRLKSQDKLPDDQVTALNELGFEWSHDEGCWQRMCRQLEQFAAEQGHCLAPPSGDTLRLAHWVYAQRALRQSGHLSSERVARLDKAGFQWSALDARWWLMRRELLAHREQHGSCEFAWDDNSVLARWCRVQRRERRSGHLSAERVAALDKLGFVWSGRTGDDKWRQRMDELDTYRQQHGHSNVPVNYPANRQLGLWVFHQRQFYKKGDIPADRVKQLEALGFTWSVRAEAWEKNFRLFKAYVEKHGHSRIAGEHRRLAAWAYDQRVAQRDSTLSSERRDRLTAMGFNWETRNSVAAK